MFAELRRIGRSEELWGKDGQGDERETQTLSTCLPLGGFIIKVSSADKICGQRRAVREGGGGGQEADETKKKGVRRRSRGGQARRKVSKMSGGNFRPPGGEAGGFWRASPGGPPLPIGIEKYLSKEVRKLPRTS